MTPPSISMRFLYRPHRNYVHDSELCGPLLGHSLITLLFLIWGSHCGILRQGKNSSERLPNKYSPLRFNESLLSWVSFPTEVFSLDLQFNMAATWGYWAPEIWLVQIEICYKCKIHTRLGRFNMKNIKYLINFNNQNSS